MSYILSEQRDTDVVGAFQRYAAYVKAKRHEFPPSALALVESDWYFDFEDHRSPHDAWLKEVRIAENLPDGEDEPPEVTLHVRLLGAYHDGFVDFTYLGVTAYDVRMLDLSHGHRDWRFDEFRLSQSGGLIHEIEWWGPKETGRWLIEARDVTYAWQPIE